MPPRSKAPPGAVKFAELKIGQRFHSRSDKSGGVWRKCGKEAAEKPDGGTTKYGTATFCWPIQDLVPASKGVEGRES